MNINEFNLNINEFNLNHVNPIFALCCTHAQQGANPRIPARISLPDVYINYLLPWARRRKPLGWIPVKHDPLSRITW